MNVIIIKTTSYINETLKKMKLQNNFAMNYTQSWLSSCNRMLLFLSSGKFK